MNRQSIARIVPVLLLAVVATGLLATGCARTSQGTAKSGPTALDGLPAARAALSGTVPDAKLLVVHLRDPISPTTTPFWSYYFWSASAGRQYLVGVADGVVGHVESGGAAGPTASEWATIPGTDAWKIDSDEAYAKAFTASGLTSAPVTYMMGLETYKSANDTSTVVPFSWRVKFFSAPGIVPTKIVDVNATTGETSVPK